MLESNRCLEIRCTYTLPTVFLLDNDDSPATLLATICPWHRCQRVEASSGVSCSTLQLSLSQSDFVSWSIEKTSSSRPRCSNCGNLRYMPGNGLTSTTSTVGRLVSLCTGPVFEICLHVASGLVGSHHLPELLRCRCLRSDAVGARAAKGCGPGEILKQFGLVLVTTVLVGMKLQGQTPISLASVRTLGRGLDWACAKNPLLDLEPHPSSPPRPHCSFQTSLQPS